LAGADHLRAGPGREQHRGCPGSQADDALRRVRQFERALIVILQLKRGLLCSLPLRQQQGRRRQQTRQLWTSALQSKKVALNTAVSAACRLASGSSSGMQAL
jgi:hypothetical protein